MNSIVIRRFSPVESLRFDQDKPIGYTPPPYEKFVISSADDIIELGKLLFEAEYKLWELQHAPSILKTFVDSAEDTMIAAANCLEKSKLPYERNQAFKLKKLVLTMKSPVLSCMAECLGAIYLKDGISAVEEAIKRLTEKGE